MKDLILGLLVSLVIALIAGYIVYIVSSNIFNQ